MTDLNRKLIWAVLFGLLVTLGVTFLADFRAVAGALAEFDIRYLPLILGLTFVNYLLRFVKWQYFLRQLDININRKDSFRIFLSGLAMSVTPGKVGELLKALLLKELKGVPVSRSAPIIFAERFSDGIAMILLALAGMAIFEYGKQVLVITIVMVAVIVLLIQSPALGRRAIALAGRLPVLNRFEQVLHRLFDSTNRLLRPQALAYSVLLGTISWFFESIAFYFVFIGLGYEISLLAATFTLSFSSVVGALSMLPGGLGAAEGSIMAILLFLGVPKSIAGVATILIRFCTLWFGVLVGLMALFRNRTVLNFAGRTEESGVES